MLKEELTSIPHTVVVSSLSRVSLRPHGLQHRQPPCPSPTPRVYSNYLLEFAQVHIHWTGEAIQPSQPLSSSSFAFSLSQDQGLFQWVGSSHQVGQVLELQHQSNEYLHLIFFRIVWLDLLAVQGILKPFSSPAPQSESINSLTLSLLYGPTLISVHDYWKNLIIQTFVGKVMFLLFNMLSKLS